MAKYLLVGSDINWIAIMALLTFVFIFSVVLLMVFWRGRDSYAEVEKQPLIDSYSSNDKTTTT